MSNRLRIAAVAVLTMFSTLAPSTNIKAKSFFKYEKCVNRLKSFDTLKEKLIQQESGGNWTIVNECGYMGLYQIGQTALSDVGIKVSLSEFNRNPWCFPPELQHRAFKKIMSNNLYYMRNYMGYIGDTIAGVVIDTSAILMGAHGVGQMAVKKFLRSNGRIDLAEGNGVRVSTIMRKFSGYEVKTDQIIYFMFAGVSIVEK